MSGWQLKRRYRALEPYEWRMVLRRKPEGVPSWGELTSPGVPSAVGHQSRMGIARQAEASPRNVTATGALNAPAVSPNPERAKALIALGFASALWGVFGIVWLLKVVL